MFSEQIDVAKIMRQIRSSVVPVEEPAGPSAGCGTAGDGEYERISAFLVNTRNVNYNQCVSVGQVLPSCSKFPGPIAKLLRLCCKVVRKFVKYIIRDQVQVNTNFDACIKALIEHDDALRREVAGLQAALDESNARIRALEARLGEKK